MRRNIAALAAGLLFGLGLSVSRMVDPAKVLAFLDVAGSWDPSLALVMAGALAVMAVAQRLILARPAPVLAPRFYVPRRNDIDRELLLGSVLFGVGWGLVGFCPGPALTALVFSPRQALAFVAAMAAGAALHKLAFERAGPLVADG